MGRYELLREYARSSRRRLAAYTIASTLVLAALSVIELKYGCGVTIKLSMILKSKLSSMIVRIRLYRLVTAILSGAILGLTGMLLQYILRNPLVDPYILGVASGGFLGSLVACLLGLPFGPASMCILSFIGGLASVAIVYVVSRASGMSVLSVVLSGVAVSMMFTGASILLIIMYPERTLDGMAWAFGSLSLSTEKTPFILLAGLAPLAVLVAYRIEWVRSLVISEDYARVRGVNVSRFMKEILIITSWSVATVTSSIGPIGFVGLMAPHIARMIIGGDVGAVAATVSLTAPVILLTGDVIARNIMPPTELPVGIIMSLFGAPFFIYLLIKCRRSFT